MNISFQVVLAELRLHRQGAHGNRPLGYAINIGANDGVTHDPTYPLFAAGFAGIAVEGAEQFRHRLISNMAAVNKSRALTVDWGFAEPATIAQRLRRAGAPSQPDALKVDIDSIDLAVLRGILSSGILPTVIMAEINHEIPPPIRWSVQPVPSFNFSLAASWAGFYGVSADALFSEMSQFGYALLGFELHNSEHNMWFVDGDLLKDKGFRVPSHEDMMEEYWRCHYVESLSCIHLNHPCILASISRFNDQAGVNPNLSDMQKKTATSKWLGDCGNRDTAMSFMEEVLPAQMKQACYAPEDPCAFETGIHNNCL